MNDQHHACIHEASYYLSVDNVYFKLDLLSKQVLILFIQFCHFILPS